MLFENILVQIFGAGEKQNWFNELFVEEFAQKISTEEADERANDAKLLPVNWCFPVDNPDVTSGFGYRNLRDRKQWHNGTDYTGRQPNTETKAPCPVIVKKVIMPDKEHPYRFQWAPTDWIDLKVPEGRAWTPYVILQAVHNKDLKFIHRHLMPLVQVGQILDTGNIVGHVGNYGFSMGLHHHDEVVMNKKNINPDKFYRGKINAQ